MEAHVLGRPMPFSSSFLTSDASVKRAGGVVACPMAVYSLTGSCWPTVRGGNNNVASVSSF